MVVCVWFGFGLQGLDVSSASHSYTEPRPGVRSWAVESERLYKGNTHTQHTNTHTHLGSVWHNLYDTVFICPSTSSTKQIVHRTLSELLNSLLPSVLSNNAAARRYSSVSELNWSSSLSHFICSLPLRQKQRPVVNTCLPQRWRKYSDLVLTVKY